MTRYLIDEANMDLEQSQATSRRLLDWAAERADAFLLGVDPAVYADPAQYHAIAALGTPAIARNEGCQAVSGSKPPKEFVHVVTTPLDMAAPVTGDLACVEDIELYRAGSRFYAMFDYGRTQLLDLDKSEAEEVLGVLAGDAQVLILAILAPRPHGA